MAVADPTVKASPPPPPPPPRIVVAVLVFVRFVLALMLAFGRVLLVAARAVPYLGFATSWVLCAGLAATLVARRVCSACSGPVVFLEARLRVAAFEASICITFLLFAREAVLLYVQCLVSLLAVVSGILDPVLSSRREPLEQSGRSRLRSRLSFPMPPSLDM